MALSDVHVQAGYAVMTEHQRQADQQHAERQCLATAVERASHSAIAVRYRPPNSRPVVAIHWGTKRESRSAAADQDRERCFIRYQADGQSAAEIA